MPLKVKDLSAKIAEEIREAILGGALTMEERLPSEAELSTRYKVSRATIREALKRLAAKNLIRTQRGATGGAFVKKLRYHEAYDDHITISTLLLSTNEVSFATACEARFALERACVPLAAARRAQEHLQKMQDEIATQSDPALSDEAFCASDVAFHRALVDAAQNPVLSYQLAGAVEAMQPLMNMITFSHRSRDRIINLHQRILEGLRLQNAQDCLAALSALEHYTTELAQTRLSFGEAAQ